MSDFCMAYVVCDLIVPRCAIMCSVVAYFIIN